MSQWDDMAGVGGCVVVIVGGALLVGIPLVKVLPAGIPAIALLAVRLLDEPEGFLAEVREDGSVELIEVV